MSFHISKRGFWFRVGNWGLSVSNERPLFSERYGYTKVLRLGQWGIQVLKP